MDHNCWFCNESVVAVQSSLPLLLIWSNATKLTSTDVCSTSSSRAGCGLSLVSVWSSDAPLGLVPINESKTSTQEAAGKKAGHKVRTAAVCPSRSLLLPPHSRQCVGAHALILHTMRRSVETSVGCSPEAVGCVVLPVAGNTNRGSCTHHTICNGW